MTKVNASKQLKEDKNQKVALNTKQSSSLLQNNDGRDLQHNITD